jgi:N-acetylneuraminic acid mutarotase
LGIDVRLLFIKILAYLVLFSPLCQDMQGQTWSTVETTGALHPRQECGFMSCKGKFYLLGGRGLQPVDIFDPATGVWSKGAVPPVEMHHFQAVRCGEQIYVMGAFSGTYPNEKPLDHIYIYDTVKDVWIRGDSIPEERQRGSAGVVTYRGELYMICGTRDRFKAANISWADRYDPRTGKWKKLADAPRARDDFQAGICDGIIYAVGGRNTSGYNGQTSGETIAEVDVFNIESGRWKTLPASQNLPTKRSGCSTVVIMDHLLVIGGESIAQKESYSVVEGFDIERGAWETWDSLEQGRSGTQAFMCVGCVFVAAGRHARNGEQLLTSIESLCY